MRATRDLAIDPVGRGGDGIHDERRNVMGRGKEKPEKEREQQQAHERNHVRSGEHLVEHLLLFGMCHLI